MLDQNGRVVVAGQLHVSQPAAQLARRGKPAEAQSTADRLRQGVDVNDVFGRPRAQPLRPRSVEAYARIDAVLEHEERPFARQLEQTLGTIRRQVLPGRVLGGSLHNNELDLVAGQDRLERLDVEAVATVRYAEHPGPGVLQGGQRAHEGR